MVRKEPCKIERKVENKEARVIATQKAFYLLPVGCI